MTATSTFACSRDMAQLRRRTWGCSFFVVSDGPRFAAVAASMVTRRSMASGVRRRPAPGREESIAGAASPFGHPPAQHVLRGVGEWDGPLSAALALLSGAYWGIDTGMATMSIPLTAVEKLSARRMLRRHSASDVPVISGHARCPRPSPPIGVISSRYSDEPVSDSELGGDARRRSSTGGAGPSDHQIEHPLGGPRCSWTDLRDARREPPLRHRSAMRPMRGQA
jgi:hypothetical protein